MTRIGIIGGGPAGLGLAHELSGADRVISLFEAGRELGGLARSFLLDDVTIERYYHFICGSDERYFRVLDELGLRKALRWRYTKMGFFCAGRLYRFSSALDLLRFDGLSVLGRLRYGLAMFYFSLIRNWHRLDNKKAEPWLISLLGSEVYKTTWYPLLSVKFPEIHQEISAAWVWHRVHRVASSRRSLFHKEKLGHLEGGTQILVDTLEARLLSAGVEVYCGTPVQRILIDDGRAVGLETAKGEQHHFDYVVSAVPLPLFLRMTLDLPASYRDRLSSIDFIGVVCIVLRLKRRLTENFWTNVHDPRIPFNGVIEYTNLNPEITPDGTSIVYVPYYVPRDDERFKQVDEELYEECLRCLRLINPELRPEDVVDYVVSRDPYAQIICPAGFSDRVPGHETPVERLYLIESSQLYPSDRTISGTLDLAHEVAKLIEAKERERVPARGGAKAEKVDLAMGDSSL